MSEFKQWILPLLDQGDYKVKTFCAEVGISRESFYQYLKGRLPTEPVYRKICEVLAVPVVDTELTLRTGTKGRPRKQVQV